MSSYVFDTEPLLAYLYDESGADEVAELLEAVERGTATGFISHATAVEVVYKVARLETGDPNHIEPAEEEFVVGKRDLEIFRRFGLAVETPPIETVARIKAAGGIALGDAYGAALAATKDATFVIGADPEFAGMPTPVTLHRIREEPV